MLKKQVNDDIQSAMTFYCVLIIASTALQLGLGGSDYWLGARWLASDLVYWGRHASSADSIDTFNQGMAEEISGLIDELDSEQKRTVAAVQRATNTTVHPPRYHRTDLEQMFNVRYLADNVNSEYVEDMQAYYGTDDTWLSQPWLDNGAQLLPTGSSDTMDALLAFNNDPMLLERRMHVEWAGAEMGFGIFASMHLEQGTLLDFYSGVVTHDNPNSDYEWLHPRLKPTDEQCGIDSRASGNMMRFSNDHPDHRNVVPVQTCHREKFYLVYQVGDTGPIQKGEQLFISYGDEYWTTRKDANADAA